MNNKKTLIISGIIALFIVLGLGKVYEIVRYMHFLSWKLPKEYMWVFEDEEKQKVEPILSIYTKKDVLNHFLYNESYYFDIWEFKDFNLPDLEEIRIRSDVNLIGLEMVNHETWGKKEGAPIRIRYGYKFDEMIICPDKESKIDHYFEAEKYKGFVANINTLALCDENYKPMITFDLAYRKKN